jgi:hypothetical protein
MNLGFHCSNGSQSFDGFHRFFGSHDFYGFHDFAGSHLSHGFHSTLGLTRDVDHMRVPAPLGDDPGRLDRQALHLAPSNPHMTEPNFHNAPLRHGVNMGRRISHDLLPLAALLARIDLFGKLPLILRFELIVEFPVRRFRDFDEGLTGQPADPLEVRIPVRLLALGPPRRLAVDRMESGISPELRDGREALGRFHVGNHTAGNARAYALGLEQILFRNRDRAALLQDHRFEFVLTLTHALVDPITQGLELVPELLLLGFRVRPQPVLSHDALALDVVVGLDQEAQVGETRHGSFVWHVKILFAMV